MLFKFTFFDGVAKLLLIDVMFDLCFELVCFVISFVVLWLLLLELENNETRRGSVEGRKKQTNKQTMGLCYDRSSPRQMFVVVYIGVNSWIFVTVE